MDCLEDLDRFDLNRESLILYFGLKDSLKIISSWESSKTTNKKVLAWVYKFVTKINPFLWEKWFDCIFKRKEIPLYRDLLFYKNKWAWFGHFHDPYGVEKPYKLSNLWGFVGVPPLDEVLIAFKSPLIKNTMIDRLIWAFTATPNKSKTVTKISKFTGKEVSITISSGSRFGIDFPVVELPADDPCTIFWSIKNLREFDLSVTKTVLFKKLVFELIILLENI